MESSKALGTEAFPSVHWSKWLATFIPSSKHATEGEATLVVIFAMSTEGWVLADIPDRGWTVPSGHIESDETVLDAAIRETAEEIGAELRSPTLIGYYVLIGGDGQVMAVPAVVGVVDGPGILPEGSESRAAACFKSEELPFNYYRWDELLAKVFAYADEALDSTAPSKFAERSL